VRAVASDCTASRAAREGAAQQLSAARQASTEPEVCSRPVRNWASSVASVTRPLPTASSSPPEWAWPPAGRRPSASVSSVLEAGMDKDLQF
jgi:hypothetical protein